ncbi:MAG: metallophosphoesterase, partial [Acutalibacteraceae bacterium]|nr:metallophosphoesterase [Acutalibacteraceae bacterium]
DMSLSDSYKILFSHRPNGFEIYKAHNIDLSLTGHVHGGQIRLPFIGGVLAPGFRMFPEYDAGVYRKDGSTMIVSRGLGNSIIPVRINDRPELVTVTLHSSK